MFVLLSSCTIVPQIPGGGDVFGYFVDFDTKRMTSWEKIIPDFKYDSQVPYFDILVPTIDTVRYGFLFEKLVGVNRSVLFTGMTGVGKSVITKGCLKQLQDSNKYVGTVMNFSAQTTSKRTQEIVESKLEKKRKTILGTFVRTYILTYVHVHLCYYNLTACKELYVRSFVFTVDTIMYAQIYV